MKTATRPLQASRGFWHSTEDVPSYRGSKALVGSTSWGAAYGEWGMGFWVSAPSSRRALLGLSTGSFKANYPVQSMGLSCLHLQMGFGPGGLGDWGENLLLLGRLLVYLEAHGA